MKRNFSKVVVLLLVLVLAIVPVFALAAFAEGETVTLDVPFGVDTPSMNADGTLPEADAPEGYTFVGWTESPMNDEEKNAPAVLITAGTEYTGTSTKLYAVYSRTEEGSSGESTTTYTLVKATSDLKVGDVIVLASSSGNFAMGAISTTSTKYGTKIDVTKSDDTLTINDDVVLLTLVEGNTSGSFGIKFLDADKYLYWTSGNSLNTETSLTNKSSWTISVASDGKATITNVATTTRAIKYNSSSPRFACYTSGQVSPAIYKQTVTTSSGEPTTYYSTMTSYTANFVGPDGAVNALRAADNKITVPAAPAFEGVFDAQEYTFVGWSATELAKDDTIAPDMLDATTLELTEDVTYYAVYSYDVKEGDGPAVESSWQLVTDAGTLAVNDQIVIVAVSQDKALAVTQNNNNRAKADVTKNDNNTVTFGSDVQIITLHKGSVDNTFAFYVDETSSVGSGYLYAASSTSNYLKTQSSIDGNASWSITVSDNIASVIANGTNTRNCLFNNYGSTMFSCYASSTTITNKDISIYKFTKGSLTTFYATKLTSKDTDVTAFDSASVTIGSDLAMNYYITLKSGESIGDYSMKFTFNGEETVVETATPAGDKYMFTFSGITPEKMGDNIKAELMKGDELIDSYDEYSVKENLITVRDEVPETTEEQKTLINATLVYGAAAQQYRDYNTDNLVAEIPDDLAGPVEKNVRDKTVSTVEGLKFTAAGVNFDYCNRIYVKYTNTTDTDAEVKVFISGTQCATKVVENNGVITVYSDALKATELGATVRFEIWQGGVEVQELKYSAYDYVYGMQGTENTALKNLIFALYQYGEAAKACNN